MEITAWYDVAKRTEALNSLSEIFYYMIHATSIEERRHWAAVYTNLLKYHHSHKHEFEVTPSPEA